METSAETSALDVSMISEVASDLADLSFVPSAHTSASDSGSSSRSTAEITKGQTKGGWGERKWIVNESSLIELFKKC